MNILEPSVGQDFTVWSSSTKDFLNWEELKEASEAKITYAIICSHYYILCSMPLAEKLKFQ